MPDNRAAHPDEVLLMAPAGTVVVFNSHLWHGGTLNRSSRPRRALHSYFTRRANGQQLDQKKYVRPETLTRLTPCRPLHPRRLTCCRNGRRRRTAAPGSRGNKWAN